VTWQRILLPSEGAKPPEEERAATLATAEGPTSYRLVGVAASEPVVGFKSLLPHHAPRAEFTLNPSAASGSGLGRTAEPDSFGRV